MGEGSRKGKELWREPGSERVQRTTGPESLNDDTTTDEEKKNFKATGSVELKGEKTSINIYFLM